MPNHIHWFECSPGVSARGVALVMHGLNLNPERMRPVTELLTGAGFVVLRLSLRGHGENYTRCAGMGEARARLESFRAASRNVWEVEARSAHDHALERAHRMGVPLLLVGYSIGGLLGVELQATRARFERMVLFAPSLSLRMWGQVLLRPLSLFPRLILPSLAGSNFFANPGTPVAAFNTLLETLQRFETRNGAGIDVPTLVLVDPGDELVSYTGVGGFIRSRGLRRWRIHPIRKDAGMPRRIPRHLVIDESMVGPVAWAGIRGAVLDHLTTVRA